MLSLVRVVFQHEELLDRVGLHLVRASVDGVQYPHASPRWWWVGTGALVTAGLFLLVKGKVMEEDEQKMRAIPHGSLQRGPT